MDIMKKAHEAAKLKQQELLDILLLKSPELAKEFEYNIRKYGVPFLNQYEGALWKEELPEKVNELLNQKFPLDLIEINIKPEDEDGHHWGIECNLLTEINGELFKAIDVDRNKQRSIEKKKLHYLTHNDKNVFSGYGIPIKNDKKYLVGLLMIDRPEKADEEWLKLIYEQFQELTLMVMSSKGDRGMFCQMEINDNSLNKIIELNAPLDNKVKRALFRHMYELPKPYFKMEWDNNVNLWKSEPIKNDN